MNKTTKVLGTLTLATLLVTAATAPVHAEGTSLESSSQSVVVADEATLTFDSVAVTTVPAPVIGETIEELTETTVPAVTEEEVVVEAPMPTPLPDPVAAEPTPEEIIPYVETTTPEPSAPVEVVPEVETPTTPPVTEEVPVPEVEIVLTIEELEGQKLAQEGETWIGSWASEEDTWTAQGYRVEISKTSFKTIGDPLSGQVVPIYHVFQKN